MAVAADGLIVERNFWFALEDAPRASHIFLVTTTNRTFRQVEWPTWRLLSLAQELADIKLTSANERRPRRKNADHHQ